MESCSAFTLYGQQRRRDFSRTCLGALHATERLRTDTAVLPSTEAGERVTYRCSGYGSLRSILHPRGRRLNCIGTPRSTNPAPRNARGVLLVWTPHHV